MLNGPSAFSEKETNEVKLSWFPSHVLSKVCMFFQGWVNQLRLSCLKPDLRFISSDLTRFDNELWTNRNLIKLDSNPIPNQPNLTNEPPQYKARYTDSATQIPEFPIEPEIALEMLMAANFLQC